MKKKIKVLIIVIAVLIILVSILYYINYLQYNLKLIGKFTVPELPKHSNHKMFDGYLVSFAVSDSVIYIIDTIDSTSTKSYSYSFDGKKRTDFKLPERTGYWLPFNEDCFYYLAQSKRLAYNNFEKRDMDFFTLEGDYIGSQYLKSDQIEWFMDMAEHGDNLYFISSEGHRGKTSYDSHLYVERSDRVMQKIKTLKPLNEKNVFCPPWKMLQIDSYNSEKMAISEVQKKDYLVTIYNQEKTDTVKIAREKYRLFPWQWPDFPYQFIMGKNFIIFGSWRKRFDLPLITRIYDLKGRYKGKLKFKDDPKNELLDIVGDRMVAINPAKGTISIYEIDVK